MRILLSYAKSHIYEIHAIIAATITFLSMFIIKKPIKRRIINFVDKKAVQNVRWKEQKRIYTRRLNLIIIFITMLLSFSIFFILSLLSPFIHFSMFSALLSGIIALTEYAVYDQFVCTRGEKNE